MGAKRLALVLVLLAGCELADEGANTSVTAEQVHSFPDLIRGDNTELGDAFGASIALSADGSTLAVGAIGEDGGARGVNPPDLDGWSPSAGAVYVFTRVDDAWVQQAYIKASNARSYNWFGASVALSADGSTLAVGAIGESSLATGINGDQDQGLGEGGAVYVFTRDHDAWSQQAYVKAHRTLAMNFGHRVALSADGDTLAATAPQDWGPDLFDGAFQEIGSVYVFGRAGTQWAQETYLQAAHPDPGDMLGHSLALSSDGTLLAAGAVNESGGGALVQGNQRDNSRPASGAVYVFRKTGRHWRQAAYLKASHPDEGDMFGGESVALSPDGTTLAATATGERSASTGVGGDQTDNSTPYAGAVYLFQLEATHWTQTSYLKASDTRADLLFGSSVALSAASLVTGAVGWTNEDPEGITGGSAYVFSTTGAVAQTEYLESPMPWDLGQFGRTVAIRADGSAIAVGAPFEEGIGSVHVFAP